MRSPSVRLNLNWSQQKNDMPHSIRRETLWPNDTLEEIGGPFGFAPHSLQRPSVLFFEDYGAEGDRTPDLLNAIEALYQLSYDPVNELQTLDFRSRIATTARRSKSWRD